MNESEKINVLIVDDNVNNLIAMEAILQNPGLNFIRAMSGKEALWKILRCNITLIILDVKLPDIDGFEVARTIKKSEKTQNIPIIFTSAEKTKMEHISRGISIGAVEYICKPIAPEILKSKVEVIVKFYKQLKLMKNACNSLICPSNT